MLIKFYSLASLIWVIQNLVIEDGVVQGQTKSDWVSWLKISSVRSKVRSRSTHWHFLLGNFEGSLVSFLWLVHDVLSLLSGSNFSQISEIITLHFQVENFGFTRWSFWDQMFVQETQNDFANFLEFLFDLFTVFVGDNLNIILRWSSSAVTLMWRAYDP